MNVFAHIEARVREAASALQEAGVLPAGWENFPLTVEPPRDASHGDVATNVAMVLSKHAKKPPRELAGHFAEKLAEGEGVASVDIAGPGFINLTMAREFWPQVAKAVLSEGDEFGRSTMGKSEKVNVEFVSANPTGPMHVGHCRGAVFGDALSNLLDFAGFDVTREYYVNDAGAQVDVLARSAFLRYCEALGEEIGEIPDGLYPGDYLCAVGKALAEEYGKRLHNLPEEEWLPIVREKAIAMMMDMIRDDLSALGIKHDVFVSERSLVEGKVNQVAKTIKDLQDAGLIFEGRLPPPKGKLPDDWEDREQTLFRSTDFGDDVDRALVKSDGSYTYFATDMANHRYKIDRGFKHLIDVFGADHGGYVTRMKAAVKALGDGEVDLDVKLCQMVRLFRAGEPVKMGKRLGTFITLREVIDEAGPGVARFIMLYRKNDAMLDFDFAKVLEESRDNPVWYVQYAHARAQSVLRNVQEAMPKLKMSGKDLANQISERLPGIKVLFMSGYAENIIIRHGVLMDGIRFIQKPFSLQTLADKVHEAMNG
ncbi:MAG: arginine--tRNA ligase [Alphaproteobacteria bacterium]